LGGSVLLKTAVGFAFLQEWLFSKPKAMKMQKPFVTEGYATYKLITLQVGNENNNYFL